MKRKVLATILTVLMIISMVPVTAFAAEFSDMPNDWSRPALENAVENGLLTGADGKLMPGAYLSRAQMAAIINRAFGATKKSALNAYSDVPSTAWYYDDMAKAVQMKTFVGSDGKLNPNGNISREEVFVVIARAFKLSGGSQSVLNKFSDKSNISSWATDSVASLVEAGYIAGSGGKISPKQYISRAEFAQIMYNLLKNYFKQAGTYIKVDKGNVMISVSDVTLKNVTIDGDLIIGDGVGDGDVILDSVKVTGRTVIRGGGVNSIKIIGNSEVGRVIITKVDGQVRVVTEDGSTVDVVYVDDGKDDVIIEGTIGSVEVSANVPVVLQNADVGSVTVSSSNSNVTIDNNSNVGTITVANTAQGSTLTVAGTVTTVNTDAPNTGITVSGTVANVTVGAGANGSSIGGGGTVNNANIQGDNTSINTVGTSVTVGGNVTGTTSGGQEVAGGTSGTTTSGGGVTPPTPPIVGGGGGGGGGPTTVAVSSVTVSPTEMTLTAGGATGTIVATVNPSNATNKTVIWSSSNESVATVSNGVVTPIAAGNAIITAASAADDNKFATTSVIVETPIKEVVRTATDVTQDPGYTGGTALEYSFNAETKTLTIDAKNTELPYYAEDDSTPPRGANWVGIAIKVPAEVVADDVTATINGVACTAPYIVDGKYMEYIDVKSAGDSTYTWIIHWGAGYADETITVNVVNVSGLYVFKPSVYEIETGPLPTEIIAGKGIEVPVRLYAKTIKELGYSNVRVNVSVSGPGTAELLAQDTKGAWHDVAKIGYWGPTNGFEVSKDYDVETNFTGKFSEAGTYTITLTLVDRADGDAELARKVVTVEVDAVTYSNYSLAINGPTAAEPGDTLVYNVRALGDSTGNTSYDAVIYNYSVTGGSGTLEYKDGETWKPLPLTGQFGPSGGFKLTPNWDVTTQLRFTPDPDGTYSVEITLDVINGDELASATHSIVVETPDRIAPTLDGVTPAEGNVELAHDGTFLLIVDAFDAGTLAELEIDHNMSSTLPEFSVYADQANPYGTDEDKAAFEDAGVTVTYKAEEQKWEIDFGTNVSNAFVVKGNVTFYIVIKDIAGNQFGTMYGTTDENTFAYTVTRLPKPVVRTATDVTQDPGYTGGTALEYSFNAETKTLTIDAKNTELPYYAEDDSTPPRGANWVGIAIKVPAEVVADDVTATINGVACTAPYIVDGKYMEYIDVKSAGDSTYTWIIHWGAGYADETITVNVVNVSGLYVFKPSVYEIETGPLPTEIIAGKGIEVPVRLYAKTIKELGYSNVRVNVSVSGPGTAELLAQDTKGAWHDVAKIGYWGPTNGFEVSKDYDVETNFTGKFSEAGTYTITLTLVDRADGDAELARKVVTVPVRAKVPMAITTNLPVKFIAGKPDTFTVSTTANDDAGRMVRAHFTLPAGATIEYQEGGVGPWLPLTDVFGPASGFPLGDIATTFRGTFANAGTYTATVEFREVGTGAVLGTKEVTVEVDAVTYTINVQTTDPRDLGRVVEGYAAQTPTEITIERTGTGDITNLAVTLSGTNSASFTVTQPTATTLNADISSTTFTIVPKHGLAVGTYTANVNVTADNEVSESFVVNFVVVVPRTLTLQGPKISSNPAPGIIANGTSVTVTVAPEAGQKPIIFTVKGVDKLTELLEDPANQYTFTITADTTVNTVVQLAQVGKPVWVGNTITWVAVDDAMEYAIQLYKDGVYVSGHPVEPHLQSYDLESIIEYYGAGSYTVTVSANADFSEGFWYGDPSEHSDAKVIDTDLSDFNVDLAVAGAKIQGTQFNLKITGAKSILGKNISFGAIKVTVNSNLDGKVHDANLSFTNGAATVPITLTTAGTHTLTVNVARVTYAETLTVEVLNNDTRVASVTVDGVLAVADGEDSEIYNVELPFGKELADLIASDILVTPTDANATVGEAATADNGATWTVVVTAEDGVTTETYIIHVTTEPAKLAIWNATDSVGTNTIGGTAYIFQGYELLDSGTNQQIALTASNIERMTVLNPGATEAANLTVGDDSDPLMWFNVRKASGDYKYIIETKTGDVYEATLTWAAPVVLEAVKQGDETVLCGDGVYRYHYVVNLDITPEDSLVYRIKPDGAINQETILADSDEVFNIYFRPTDGSFTQQEGDHIYVFKKGSVWYQSVITYTEPIVFNGAVSGVINTDGLGVVSGTLAGDYNLTVTGQVTAYVNNRATFSGTVSGDITGSITATINANGIDTMSGIITGTGAEETVRIIGTFPQTGIKGDFSGEIITGPEPTYVESMTINTEGDVSTVSVDDTLQLTVEVLPIGASSEVCWSVWTSGGASTDFAIIDQNGVLTGVSSGTVVVISKALDGSLKDATKIITIVDALTVAKMTAKAALAATLSEYEETDYTPENWTVLTNAKTAGDAGIDAATDLAGVASAKDAALAAMAAVETIAETDERFASAVETMIAELSAVPELAVPKVPDVIPKPDAAELDAVYVYLEYLENAGEVAAAKAAFDSLRETAQELVDTALQDKLEAAVVKVEELTGFVINNTIVGIGTYREDYSGLTAGAKGRIMVTPSWPFYLADGLNSKSGMTNLEMSLHNGDNELVRNTANLAILNPSKTGNWPTRTSGSFDLGVARPSSSGSWNNGLYQLIGDKVTQADLPDKVVVEFTYKGVAFVIETSVNYTPDMFVEIKAAHWNATDSVGTNTIGGTAYIFQGYELLDSETTQQIALTASNIERMTVLNPGATEAANLTVGDDSDPLLWFNVRKASGDYKYIIETKTGDVYEATLTCAAPVVLEAVKQGDEPVLCGDGKYRYHYIVNLDITPEDSLVYRIKPDGAINQETILADSDEVFNIYFRPTDGSFTQQEGDHIYVFKKGSVWYEAIISYTSE